MLLNFLGGFVVPWSESWVEHPTCALFKSRLQNEDGSTWTLFHDDQVQIINYGWRKRPTEEPLTFTDHVSRVLEAAEKHKKEHPGGYGTGVVTWLEALGY
jgi:hypothetical protein